jgi:hypothetical protein
MVTNTIDDDDHTLPPFSPKSSRLKDCILPVLHPDGLCDYEYINSVVAFCRYLTHGFLLIHEILRISILSHDSLEYINHSLLAPYLQLMTIMYEEFMHVFVNKYIITFDLKSEYMLGYTKPTKNGKSPKLKTTALPPIFQFDLHEKPRVFDEKIYHKLNAVVMNFRSRFKDHFYNFRSLVYATEFLTHYSHEISLGFMMRARDIPIRYMGSSHKKKKNHWTKSW